MTKRLYRKKRIIIRMIAMILCAAILCASTDFSSIGDMFVKAAGKNTLNEWIVEAVWDNYDSKNYEMTSSYNETLRPKMIFKYFLPKAEKDYAVGDVRFRINGIDDIGRNGLFPAKTTVNQSDTKWMLDERVPAGEYLFYNKYEIKQGEALSGGFEIMWEFDSRSGLNGYQKTIVPVFSVNDGTGNYNSIDMPELTFEYNSVRDYYYLDLNTDKITSKEYQKVNGIGPDGNPTPYEKYAWYNETLKFNPQTKARGVSLSDLFVAVKVTDPDTHVEIAQSEYSRIEVLRNDGKRVHLTKYNNLMEITNRPEDNNVSVWGYFEFRNHTGDLSNNDYVFYLGYPNISSENVFDPVFDGKSADVKVYLNALYKDEDEYITMRNYNSSAGELVFAESENIKENYSFEYGPGTYYHEKKNQFYEKSDHTQPDSDTTRLLADKAYSDGIVDFILNIHGGENYTYSSAASKTTKHTTSSSAQYDREKGFCAIQGDDWLAVETESGRYRRLEADEYNIATVTVPADKYKLEYDVFAATELNTRLENYELVGTGKTDRENVFPLEKKKRYCAFYVKFYGIKGEYDQKTKVGIRFHIRNDVTYTDPVTNEEVMWPKPKLSGNIANFSFFRMYNMEDVRTASIENSNMTFIVDADDYYGTYAIDNILPNDMILYNDPSLDESDPKSKGYIYRKFSNVFMRESVTLLYSNTVTNDGESSDTYIKKIDDDYGGGAAFTISTSGSIRGEVDAQMKKFSIHTLLPPDLKPQSDLSEIRYGSGENDVLEGIKLSGFALDADGNEITVEQLEDHVEYDVREIFDESDSTYKTVVTAYFDFSDMPLEIKSMTNVKMTYPVRVDRMAYKSGTKDFMIYSFTSIQDEGVQKINGTYIQNDIHNIDNNNKTAYVAQSCEKVIGSGIPNEFQNKAHKSVKTYFTTQFTSAEINTDKGIDNRVKSFASTGENVDPDERTTYTYRLEMEMQEAVSDIVMYDNIEPVNGITYESVGDDITVRSDWHGKLLSVDTTFLSKIENLKYTVFYSNAENETGTISNRVASSGSGWKEMTPNGSNTLWSVPEADKGKARSVAVSIDTTYLKGGTIANSALYVLVNMQTPLWPDPEPEQSYIARNNYKLTYVPQSSLMPDNYMFSTITNVELMENLPEVIFEKNDGDSDGKRRLKGAEFELWEDKNKNGTIDSGTDKLIDAGITNNLGRWTTYKMEYGKKYLLKETKSPDGFYAETNPLPVELVAESGKNTYTINVINKRNRGIVDIVKLDADGGVKGNLAGAEFEVYTSANEQVFFVDNGDGTYTYNDESTEVVGLCVTNENGITLNNMPWGNYYIKEVSAPEGFEINGEILKFSVSSRNTGKDANNEDITIPLEKTDTEKQASLVLRKYSDTGDVLSGAWYNLQKWNATAKKWEDKASNLQTDKSGFINIDGLKFGRYRFVEINAPIGYEMKGVTDAENTAKSPLVDKLYFDGLSAGQEIDAADYFNRETGTITLNADTAELTLYVNDVNVHKTGSATIKKLKEDGTPLQGAVFDLYMIGEDNSELLIKSGMTTDEDGKISYDTGEELEDGFYGAANLEWGRYKFVETYVPTGYVLDPTPVEFELNANNVSTMAELVKYNSRKKGSVILNKLAEEDTSVGGTVIAANSLLAGAVFSLYTSDDKLIKLHKVSDAHYVLSENDEENIETELITGSTGDDLGRLYIDGLEWGSYYLDEIKAPSGFKPAEKTRFSVNAYTCSAAQEIDCYDGKMECELIINKEVDDIVDSFGTAVFMFRITDVNDEDNSWIKTIVVGKDTRKGTVSMSVPVGEYKVEELRVARYKLESSMITLLGKTQYATVTSNTDGTLNCKFTPGAGQTGIADVTFRNKLSNYLGIGDNSSVTNILPARKKITGLSLEYQKVVPVVKNGTGTYDLKTDELVGYLVYDDGSTSEPLTKELLDLITYNNPATGGFSVKNGVNDANSEQMISAVLDGSNASVAALLPDLGSKKLRTNFFVTIGSLQTTSVQKVIYNVDANNATYFLKNGKRVTSNVVYYNNGERINGTYLTPIKIDTSNSETMFWMDKISDGTTISGMDEADIIEWLDNHPDVTELNLYVRIGRPVYKFGQDDNVDPDDGGEYDPDDPDSPYADPDPGTTPDPGPDPQALDKYDEWTAEKDGYYQIRAWGASGGDLYNKTDYANRALEKHGGHGGFSEAFVYLTEGTTLYIFRGGKGMNATESGNDKSYYEGPVGGVYGGGDGGGSYTGSGGGTTYVSLTKNPIKSGEVWNKEGVLIVAGAGGGAGSDSSGGDAVSAGSAETSNTQGVGADAGDISSGGAGAGYYGGSSNSGGSSYAASGTIYAGFQGAEIMSSRTLAGNVEIPTYSGAKRDQTTGKMIGHIGNGYVEITPYYDTMPIEYTGQVGSFTAPQAGYYKLEAWGAAGGYAKKPDLDNLTNVDISTWEDIEGGRGGYSTGLVYLAQGQTIYYAVGGKGDSFIDDDVTTTGSFGGIVQGGFNGGGAAAGRKYNNSTKVVYYSGAGGGATHFALAMPSDSSKTGVLKDYESEKSSVLLVAGGGGGSGTSHNITSLTNRHYGAGGAGGGLEGQGNYDFECYVLPGPGHSTVTLGGTQTSGGTFYALSNDPIGKNGAFGQGGSAPNGLSDLDGGGGGWYGGAAGGRMGGAGGSGYVGNTLVINGETIAGNKVDYEMSDGTVVTPTDIPTFEGAIVDDGIVGTDCYDSTMIGNRGNGFAQITYVGNVKSVDYDYTNKIETFTAPFSGYYLLEAWGAQGGMSGLGEDTDVPEYILKIDNLRSDVQSHYNAEGGRGGYSYGYVHLTAGQTIYIGVGGAGKTTYNVGNTYTWGDYVVEFKTEDNEYINLCIAKGGFNGGDLCYVPEQISDSGRFFRGSGGGATHFSLTMQGSGLLSEYESSKDDVLLVAGGGGGSALTSNINNQDSFQFGSGGYGGGLTGGSPTSQGWNNTNYYLYTATGGGQTSGGGIVSNSGSSILANVGNFGQACGTNGYPDSPYVVTETSYSYVGGGGGWYGGTNVYIMGGSGGSGHVNATALSSAFDMDTIGGDNIFPSPDGDYENGHRGNGHAKVTFVTFDDVTNFGYTGNVQTFVAPETGKYLLEGWGASGGGVTGLTNDASGGAGAYTSGEIELKKGQTIYIYVGGEGSTINENEETAPISVPGGWNGGANATQNDASAVRYNSGTHAGEYRNRRAGAGGGATDFRLVKGNWDNFDSLKSRIMVAAGGGGGMKWDEYSSVYNAAGGAGGALIGDTGIAYNGNSRYTDVINQGGKQTEGGYTIYINDATQAHRGMGGFGTTSRYRVDSGSGAGSGYYSGGSAYHCAGSGGGSSFVSGYTSSSGDCDAISYQSTGQDNIIHTGQPKHYSGMVFTSPTMISGSDVSGMPSHENSGKTVGNTGNGYARVTYLGGTDDSNFSQSYSFTGSVQTFIAPKTAVYKFEAWGASGASLYGDDTVQGGAGAYTSGEIKLQKGQEIYVYVGGEGTMAYVENGTAYTAPGGWNGGGSSWSQTSQPLRMYGAGGGATDFRLVKGNWNNFDSLKSRIMVAAGGGGALRYAGDQNLMPQYNACGGAGGALVGYPGGKGVERYGGVEHQGATQTAGGYSEKRNNSMTDLEIVGIGLFGKASKVGTGASTGGGSGYYAGGSSHHVQGSGGGSSFVSGYTSSAGDCDAISKDSTSDNIIHTGQPNHYSGFVFKKATMISGKDDGGMPNNKGVGRMIGNVGDGYARISIVN